MRTALALIAAAAMTTAASAATQNTAPAADANTVVSTVNTTDGNVALPADPNLIANTPEIDPMADTAAAPAPVRRDDDGFPWGLIGLVGLVGLLGRARR